MLPCMVINYPSLGLARLHFISYILIKKKKKIALYPRPISHSNRILISWS
jgi:hypothetical protein